MLTKAKDLTNYKLGARDGEIGRIKDFYFEADTWTVRYVLVDTGTWLSGRKVLVSPYAMRSRDRSSRVLHVDLTQDQIRNSPPMDEHMPVSRKYELEYYKYYNWPYYWHGPALWGPTELPAYPASVDPALHQTSSMPQPSGEPNLHSTEAINGYRIHARDGEFGHIEDFLLDDQAWVIRYLLIDTKNWWPGKPVLLPPEWAAKIDWQNSEIRVDTDRAVIERAPEYDSNQELTRDFEERLFQHYGRPTYWGGGRRMAA